MKDKFIPDLSNFSLVNSGLFYKLVVVIGLGEPTKRNIRFRAIGLMAITWIPLLLLTAFQGLAFGEITLPFWKDFSTHMRLLVVLPLLIFAETEVERKLKELTSQFFKAGILNEGDASALDRIKAQISKLTNSIVIDIIFLILILSNVVSRLAMASSLNANSWLLLPDNVTLSWAAYYAGFVSLVFFQFILLRWIWRWIIWIIYFVKISKLPLKLNSAHPDKAGGLGFLGFPPGPFVQVNFALAILFSVYIAQRVFFHGAQLPAFYPIMIGFAVFSILINVLPLLVFIPPLLKQRRKGFFEYGALIQEHHRQFDNKWIHSQTDEELPGTGDASSATDFNTTFDVVKSMGIFPFDLKIMISSIVIALLPILPLLAFEYDVFKLLLKIIGMLA